MAVFTSVCSFMNQGITLLIDWKNVSADVAHFRGKVTAQSSFPLNSERWLHTEDEQAEPDSGNVRHLPIIADLIMS